MEYPKINTLWKRDDNGKIIEQDYAYSCPEFFHFNKWYIEEKIDGTNIRIYIDNNKITTIKGRKNDSVVPIAIIDFIEKKREKIESSNLGSCILFGEGFGGNIQHGKDYRPDVSFMIFDIYMNGTWFDILSRNTIAGLLELEVPRCINERLSISDIVSFVKSKPRGLYNNNQYPMEGIIARLEPIVCFNNKSRDPIIFKLKVRDYYGKNI